MDRIGSGRHHGARSQARQRELSVTPRLHNLLRATAARECRILTNALKMLLTDYSRRHGLTAVIAAGEPLVSALKGSRPRPGAAAGPCPETSPARRTRKVP